LVRFDGDRTLLLEIAIPIADLSAQGANSEFAQSLDLERCHPAGSGPRTVRASAANAVTLVGS